MLGDLLYSWLIVVGTVDAFLVAPALTRAANAQTRGRLMSTEAVLGGLVLASWGRIADQFGIVIPGLLLICIGLTGYAFTLPERNLLDRLRGQ